MAYLGRRQPFKPLTNTFNIWTLAGGLRNLVLTADGTTAAETPTTVTLRRTYNLTAALTTFTETATAITFKRGLRLNAASTSFAETPSSVTLSKTAANTLTAAGATFSETPTAINFRRGFILTAAGRSFAFTPQDIQLRLGHLTPPDPAHFLDQMLTAGGDGASCFIYQSASLEATTLQAGSVTARAELVA